jgi:hypothetical protein
MTQVAMFSDNAYFLTDAKNQRHMHRVERHIDW